MPDQPQSKALFISDIVDFEVLIEDLGAERWAELSGIHDEMAREIFQQFGGVEIDKTDGFLVLFDRPIDAVQAALGYHTALSAHRELSAAGFASRAGIEYAEVTLRANSPEEVALGAKPTEVEGVAKLTAASLMFAAGAGQTLMGRAAFDLARRTTAQAATLPAETEWLAHGTYQLQGLDHPVQVFEVGVPGEAPLSAPPNSPHGHPLPADGESPLPGWRPAGAANVLGRDHWVLGEKLGETAVGEVWRGNNIQTGEQRAFKFCFSPVRLAGLQAEAGSMRLLHDTVGDRKDIGHPLEWSLGASPFFVESEFCQGGNLLDWAQRQGGIAKIPVDKRLVVIAQIANALAFAHSVGVLHKNIKPSNILLDSQTNAPRVRLGDFCSGVTSKDRLTLPSTRLYSAPEVLEGKPSTIQADIYALGVLLYQMATGDLARAVPANWQEAIKDDLLREDIAACLAPDPRQRLASAAQLAERLTTMDRRRAELAEKQEGGAAKVALQQARARNRLVLFGCGVLACALVGALALYWTAREGAGVGEVATPAEQPTPAASPQAPSPQVEQFIKLMATDAREALLTAGAKDVVHEMTRQAAAYFADLPPESLTAEHKVIYGMLLVQSALDESHEMDPQLREDQLAKGLATLKAEGENAPHIKGRHLIVAEGSAALARILFGRGDSARGLETIATGEAAVADVIEYEPVATSLWMDLQSTKARHLASEAEAGAVLTAALSRVSPLIGASSPPKLIASFAQSLRHQLQLSASVGIGKFDLGNPVVAAYQAINRLDAKSLESLGTDWPDIQEWMLEMADRQVYATLGQALVNSSSDFQQALKTAGEQNKIITVFVTGKELGPNPYPIDTTDLLAHTVAITIRAEDIRKVREVDMILSTAGLEHGICYESGLCMFSPKAELLYVGHGTDYREGYQRVLMEEAMVLEPFLQFLLEKQIAFANTAGIIDEVRAAPDVTWTSYWQKAMLDFVLPRRPNTMRTLVNVETLTQPETTGLGNFFLAKHLIGRTAMDEWKKNQFGLYEEPKWVALDYRAGADYINANYEAHRIAPNTPARILIIGPRANGDRVVQVAGSLEATGTWIPNTVPLTPVAEFPPFTIWELKIPVSYDTEYKFTYGKPGEGWLGTEEWIGGGNRKVTNHMHAYRTAEKELLLLTFFGGDLGEPE